MQGCAAAIWTADGAAPAVAAVPEQRHVHVRHHLPAVRFRDVRSERNLLALSTECQELHRS